MRLVHGQAPAGRAAVSREKVALGVASLRAIAGLGQLILRSGVLSARTRSELENTLAASGLHGTNGLAAYIGGKIMLAAGLPALAWAMTHNVELPNLISTLLPGRGWDRGADGPRLDPGAAPEAISGAS